MKKIVLTSAVLFTTLMTFAQGSQASDLPEAVKKQVAVLKSSDLKLSEVQLARITTVLVAENDKVEKSKKMLEANNQQLNERLKLLKEIMIQNVKGGMTPLQAEKFDAEKLGDKL